MSTETPSTATATRPFRNLSMTRTVGMGAGRSCHPWPLYPLGYITRCIEREVSPEGIDKLIQVRNWAKGLNLTASRLRDLMTLHFPEVWEHRMTVCAPMQTSSQENLLKNRIYKMWRDDTVRPPIAAMGPEHPLRRGRQNGNADLLRGYLDADNGRPDPEWQRKQPNN